MMILFNLSTLKPSPADAFDRLTLTKKIQKQS